MKKWRMKYWMERRATSGVVFVFCYMALALVVWHGMAQRV